MRLTETLYQEKDGNPFQCIEITVDYSHRTVNEIISVVAYEFGKERIDVSEIFMKHFENDLNKLIDQVDWAELAAVQHAEDSENKKESLFETFGEIFKPVNLNEIK